MGSEALDLGGWLRLETLSKLLKDSQLISHKQVARGEFE